MRSVFCCPNDYQQDKQYENQGEIVKISIENAAHVIVLPLFVQTGLHVVNVRAPPSAAHAPGGEMVNLPMRPR
jgi:hypothetical protein